MLLQNVEMSTPLFESFPSLTVSAPCVAVNCGLVYVQNAARDGATAWVLGELMDRSLRVWENIPGVRVIAGPSI